MINYGAIAIKENLLHVYLMYLILSSCSLPSSPPTIVRKFPTPSLHWSRRITLHSMTPSFTPSSSESWHPSRKKSNYCTHRSMIKSHLMLLEEKEQEVIRQERRMVRTICACSSWVPHSAVFEWHSKRLSWVVVLPCARVVLPPPPHTKERRKTRSAVVFFAIISPLGQSMRLLPLVEERRICWVKTFFKVQEVSCELLSFALVSSWVSMSLSPRSILPVPSSHMLRTHHLKF